MTNYCILRRKLNGLLRQVCHRTSYGDHDVAHKRFIPNGIGTVSALHGRVPRPGEGSTGQQVKEQVQRGLDGDKAEGEPDDNAACSAARKRRRYKAGSESLIKKGKTIETTMPVQTCCTLTGTPQARRSCAWIGRSRGPHTATSGNVSRKGHVVLMPAETTASCYGTPSVSETYPTVSSGSYLADGAFLTGDHKRGKRNGEEPGRADRWSSRPVRVRSNRLSSRR